MDVIETLSFDQAQHHDEQHRVCRRTQCLVQDELDHSIADIELAMRLQQLFMALLVFCAGLLQSCLGNSPSRKAVLHRHLENVIRRCNDGGKQHELEYLDHIHCKEVLRRLAPSHHRSSGEGMLPGPCMRQMLVRRCRKLH